MKLISCSQVFVRDLLACPVPPNIPAFSRPPLWGGGSAPTEAAGSPKSIAGECSAGRSLVTNRFKAGSYRPITLFRW